MPARWALHEGMGQRLGRQSEERTGGALLAGLCSNYRPKLHTDLLPCQTGGSCADCRFLWRVPGAQACLGIR